MGVHRFAQWVGIVFSALLMAEVLMMVSPFAFYGNSFYSPTLQILRRTRGRPPEDLAFNGEESLLYLPGGGMQCCA